MKRTLPLRTHALTALAFGVCLQAAHAAIILDPPLVTGTGVIDPAGQQTVDQTASGATPLATFKALSGLAAIQDFTGFGTQSAATYVVFNADTTRADIKASIANVTGVNSGGSVTDPNLITSPGAGIRLNSGSTRASTLTFDFGSATYDGTSVTAFDSAAKAPTAVGFTVSGLANVNGNVTVVFYGTDDTTVLSTQVLNTASDPDAGDGTTYGSDGYVGFTATGTGVSGGIGKVVLTANQLLGSTPGLGIDDLAYTAGKAYYLTVAGAGAKTGSSWANALPASQLNNTVNTTLAPNDTLNIGSGNYGTTNLGVATGQLTITSSGTAGNPKRIVGVDTGSGLPVFDTGKWSRTDPDGSTTGNKPYAFSFNGTSSYWEVNNLVFRSYLQVFTTSASDPVPHYGLTFLNDQLSNVREGFHLNDVTGLTITNCSVVNYTKYAFNLYQGCNTVTFTSCTADLTNGDLSWWDYAESFPYGYTVGGYSTQNSNARGDSNLSFTGCVARNNRKNNQSGGYWNGDGFSVELNTGGTTVFTDCVATNNEDAGYDIKPAATFTNCSAVHHRYGYRCWDTAKTFTNCVGTFPFNRSTTYPNGQDGGGACIWVQKGTVTANYFTAHGNAGFGGEVTGTGGSLTLNNSIVSFTGAAGEFVHGTGASLGSGTVTYRPGAGVDPQYVNPQPTWNGLGTDMNSQTYTTTKGWFAP